MEEDTTRQQQQQPHTHTQRRQRGGHAALPSGGHTPPPWRVIGSPHMGLHQEETTTPQGLHRPEACSGLGFSQKKAKCPPRTGVTAKKQNNNNSTTPKRIEGNIIGGTESALAPRQPNVAPGLPVRHSCAHTTPHHTKNNAHTYNRAGREREKRER